MKRFLSLLVIGLVGVIPFVVKAETSLSYNCTDIDTDSYRTCTISADLATAADTLKITLTEKGGADVTAIENVTSSEWDVGTPTESAGVHTINLSYVSPDPSHSGETTLFKFTYKVSGETDCSVLIGLDGISKTVSTPNSTTPNKQTGISVPYIALGAITLLAVGAYMATRNKAKMFNI